MYVCVCVSVSVYDLGTSTMRRPRPELGCCRTDSKVQNCFCAELSIKLCRRLTVVNLDPEVKASGRVQSVFKFTLCLGLTSGSVFATAV